MLKNLINVLEKNGFKIKGKKQFLQSRAPKKSKVVFWKFLQDFMGLYRIFQDKNCKKLNINLLKKIIKNIKHLLKKRFYNIILVLGKDQNNVEGNIYKFNF